MLNTAHQRTSRRQPGARARGLSLIELLVGMVVGLFIVGGALTLFVRNVVGSRQLLTETRLNQDLRSAMDLVTRDLRRAGYWGNAINGTIAIGTTAVTAANPYSTVTSSGSEVTYDFSTDLVENNALNASGDEQFGARLNGAAIQLQTSSGTWTDITDPRSLTITAFTITPTNTVLDLGTFCVKTCAAGSPGCPTVTVRSFSIAVTGQSVRDANVQRSLRSIVRPRNDTLAGVCPT